MNARLRSTTFLSACALALLAASPAWAVNWNPNPSPINPFPGLAIPSPDVVPGKDYSDHSDKDLNGISIPEQVLAWDGYGGTRNSFNYAGSRNAFPEVAGPLQVDGIGAGGDALFHALRSDEAGLIFSVGDLGYGGIVGDGRLFAEPVAAAGGSGAGYVWATVPQVDSLGITDLDGVELWGGNQVDDSDRYSVYRDPFVNLPAASLKVAIWAYDPGAHNSTPHTFTADLAAAMDQQFGGPGNGALFSQLVELMDVDAIMTFGPLVTFSIAPLDLSPFGLPNFDGGEIFVYDGANTATTFLNHGGHLWDTLFNVQGTFGVLSENIDAIEAASVPEPSAIILFGLGLVGAVAFAARRRRGG